MNTFDFDGDLMRIVEKALDSSGVKRDAAASLEDLMLLLFNHQAKMIRPADRTVHESAVFRTKKRALSANMKAAADSILSKFKTGEDVSGHLSRKSNVPSKLDGLIADWGIHHIHISITKRNASDKFYDRTGPLIFVMVIDTDAYVLDIHPHDPEPWTRIELLEIIDKEWPHLLDPHTLKSITGGPSHMGAVNLKHLRDGGVQVPLKVGGRFIAPPGGGLASDGKTPSDHLTRADYIRGIVTNLEEWLTNNLEQVSAAIEKEMSIAKGDQDYELVSLDNGWGIHEKKSGLLLRNTSPAKAGT